MGPSQSNRQLQKDVIKHACFDWIDNPNILTRFPLMCSIMLAGWRLLSVRFMQNLQRVGRTHWEDGEVISKLDSHFIHSKSKNQKRNIHRRMLDTVCLKPYMCILCILLFVFEIVS
jgi:hypothetical protein